LRVKLSALKSLLHSNPEAFTSFLLPTGELIPAHFHLTEVGHVRKKFVDCGGVFRESEACLLQAHAGLDIDHRLRAKRFADILELARPVLPARDLDVEVEWDCCVISQYPVKAARVSPDEIEFRLVASHTACLAKRKCDCESESTAKPCGCC
jgi:hypothetical protein